jgi:hypothetical protein
MQSRAEPESSTLGDFGQPDTPLMEYFWLDAFGHQDHFGAVCGNPFEHSLNLGEIVGVAHHELELVIVSSYEALENFGLESQPFMLHSQPAFRGRMGEFGADAHQIARDGREDCARCFDGDVQAAGA